MNKTSLHHPPQTSCDIEVEKAFYSYDGLTDALTSVDLNLSKGQRVCILGRNGSGKSTLAHLFNALLIPDEGVVSVLGRRTDDDENAVIIRRHVGMVFQNPDDQMVTSIVEDDIAFGPENLGVERDEIIKRINEALSVVRMQHARQADPTSLSGGQKQRIAIAGVLAMQPEIIVFDEPTAMLDPQGRAEVLAQMDDLAAHGYTIIHVTHDMDDTLQADRVIVLSHGFIAFDGTPDELFAQPNLVLELGLEPPFALQVSEELKSRGLIGTSTCKTDELLEVLCQSLTKA